MKGIATTLATLWRLGSPYFWSEDRWPGRLLLGAVIAIELSMVYILVLVNLWNARFYNALQDRSWDTFVTEILISAGSPPPIPYSPSISSISINCSRSAGGAG